MKLRLVFQFQLMALLGVTFAFAQRPVPEAIPNWAAPPFWSQHSRSSSTGLARTPSAEGIAVFPLNTSPLPFIGITACRIADTRGNGFTGLFGPPSIGADTRRVFPVRGQCGIPAGAEAVSFNFAALNVSAAGDLRVFANGAPVSTVSTLNYNANTPNIANAAIVPLGINGAIIVQADATTIDLIIDVNGYYGPMSSGDDSNLFVGRLAGASTITGHQNAGIGNFALSTNNSGSNNTALGNKALETNDNGSHNTAAGHSALFSNQSGTSNTAAGESALLNNVSGHGNTAVGDSALLGNTGGDQNTAIGANALQGATGSRNIALGIDAGASLTTGNDNIDIGQVGVSGESGTIRVGTSGIQTKTFVAGVRDVTTGMMDGQTVMIDSEGQLGTISSSAGVKRGIADVGEESSALLKLRPVSFFYRNDTIGIRQYGLIAEEVAEVFPDLVQFSPAGTAQAVRYHFLPPLLLSEIQKQQQTIRDLRRLTEAQAEQMKGLAARLLALEGLIRSKGATVFLSAREAAPCPALRKS